MKTTTPYTRDENLDLRIKELFDSSSSLKEPNEFIEVARQHDALLKDLSEKMAELLDEKGRYMQFFKTPYIDSGFIEGGMSLREMANLHIHNPEIEEQQPLKDLIKQKFNELEPKLLVERKLGHEAEHLAQQAEGLKLFAFKALKNCEQLPKMPEYDVKKSLLNLWQFLAAESNDLSKMMNATIVKNFSYKNQALNAEEEKKLLDYCEQFKRENTQGFNFLQKVEKFRDKFLSSNLNKQKLNS